MPRLKNKGGHPEFHAHPVFAQNALSPHFEYPIPTSAQLNDLQQSGTHQNKMLLSYYGDHAPCQQYCANGYGDIEEPSSDFVGTVSYAAQLMAPTISWHSAFPGTASEMLAIPESRFLCTEVSPGWSTNHLPPYPIQLRQDVLYNDPAFATHRHYPMALPVASSTQSQKESPRWPPQTAPASPRAALPRPTPRNPVTDEDFREHLAELGAPTEKFQAEKCKIGRPRECEIAAPKHQDYTAEDFERAQRYYRKYHNAWRNFHSAKLRLAEASAQDKGRLQKLTLKNAELLKHGKEDYLSFDRTRLPLKSGASSEQRQKRLHLLQKKLEDSRQKISKTEEFLSLGKITPEEAAASLQRQKHWKSKMGGEIADIDFEIQHESVLPNDGQLACGNAGTGNIQPADASLLSLEDSSDHFTNSISGSTNGYQVRETPHVSLLPQQLIIPSTATFAHVNQVAQGNPNNNITPAYIGLSSQDIANNVSANNDPDLIAGCNGIQQLPNTHVCPQNLTISPDAARLSRAGAQAAMGQSPSSLIPGECYNQFCPQCRLIRPTIPTNGSGLDPPGSSILKPAPDPTGLMTWA